MEEKDMREELAKLLEAYAECIKDRKFGDFVPEDRNVIRYGAAQFVKNMDGFVKAKQIETREALVGCMIFGMFMAESGATQVIRAQTPLN